ncbi:MAG TPA: hypothetical protein VLL05_06225, partial [Terriglobales bacterium]|nr:hypothetical protein [Terriglobales bacterium]
MRRTISGNCAPDARDVAAVLAQVVGLVDRVELHRGVEEREDDDQRRLDDDVRPRGGRKVRVDEGLRARRERADRLGQRQQRRGEDDRDHAGHVHAQRHVGRLAACHLAADHPLRVLDGDAPLAFLDVDDRDDDPDRDQREEQLLHHAAV